MKDKYHGYELHDHNYPDSLIASTDDVRPESKVHILKRKEEERQKHFNTLDYKDKKLIERIANRVKVFEVIRWQEKSDKGRVWFCERTAEVED